MEDKHKGNQPGQRSSDSRPAVSEQYPQHASAGAVLDLKFQRSTSALGPASANFSRPSTETSTAGAAYRELMDSDRWQRLANAGHACSGCSGPASTKDPRGLGHAVRPTDSLPRLPSTPCRTRPWRHTSSTVTPAIPCRRTVGNASELLGRFTEAGVDTDALAAKLQSDGARSFADAWGATC